MAVKDKSVSGAKPRKNVDAQGATTAKAAPSAKVGAVAKVAARKAADLASKPLVAEVVAATLVAAAAAMRDPKKARAIAAAAGDELQNATKNVGKGGEALWQLAMDVAGRSIEALGVGGGEGKPAKNQKAKKAAAKKAKAKKAKAKK